MIREKSFIVLKKFLIIGFILRLQHLMACYMNLARLFCVLILNVHFCSLKTIVAP